MPNFEKYNEEEAKKLIESAGLKDTPVGKYMEGQPMPLEDELKEDGKEMTKEELFEYLRSLNEDLFDWIKNFKIEGEKFDEEELEFVEQGILSGDYREIEYWLKKVKGEEKAEKLFQRIQDKSFKEALSKYQSELLSYARGMLHKWKK